MPNFQENFRISLIFVSILERNMSLIEEHLWQSSKRWVSSYYYHYRGYISFPIERVFGFSTCFNTWVVATDSEFNESSSHGIFSCWINVSRQNGYSYFKRSDKSLVYMSAEAFRSNKRHISFSCMSSTSCLMLLSDEL